ncbi:hypothetical protein NHJ13051_009652 [Beauveria bassiana]
MGAFATRALQATPAAAGDAPVAPAAAATTSKPAQKKPVPESNGDERKPQGKQHKPKTSKSRKDENSKINVHYASSQSVATAPTRFRCKVGGEWKDLSVFSNAQQRTLRYLSASGQPAPRSRTLRTRPEQLASHNAKQYARVFIQPSEPRDVEYCHQA